MLGRKSKNQPSLPLADENEVLKNTPYMELTPYGEGRALYWNAWASQNGDEVWVCDGACTGYLCIKFNGVWLFEQATNQDPKDETWGRRSFYYPYAPTFTDAEFMAFEPPYGIKKIITDYVHKPLWRIGDTFFSSRIQFMQELKKRGDWSNVRFYNPSHSGKGYAARTSGFLPIRVKNGVVQFDTLTKREIKQQIFVLPEGVEFFYTLPEGYEFDYEPSEDTDGGDWVSRDYIETSHDEFVLFYGERVEKDTFRITSAKIGENRVFIFGDTLSCLNNIQALISLGASIINLHQPIDASRMTVEELRDLTGIEGNRYAQKEWVWAIPVSQDTFAQTLKSVAQASHSIETSLYSHFGNIPQTPQELGQAIHLNRAGWRGLTGRDNTLEGENHTLYYTMKMGYGLWVNGEQVSLLVRSRSQTVNSNLKRIFGSLQETTEDEITASSGKTPEWADWKLEFAPCPREYVHDLGIMDIYEVERLMVLGKLVVARAEDTETTPPYIETGTETIVYHDDYFIPVRISQCWQAWRTRPYPDSHKGRIWGAWVTQNHAPQDEEIIYSSSPL